MFYLHEFYPSMKMANTREKMRRAGFFSPFRIHFVLILVALLLAWQWLRKNNAIPETSRTAIIDVFVEVTFWFALVTLLVCFFTAFIPWVLFLLEKRAHSTTLKVSTPGSQALHRQTVEVNIPNIWQPLFGYIRLRLLYDGDHVSPKFSLLPSDEKTTFFSKNLHGFYQWPLQNIKEYDVTRGIIYFEDLFQFFSFTATMATTGNFFTQPAFKATQSLSVPPKKTEDTNVRIEEMRKVEGEFLNYKNFENNDDVRRIVWKIYAKNKELVVRVPETNDPYASHIYFYASFFDSLSNDLYTGFNDVFLDNFKTAIWNVYEQLFRQNEWVQFIPDQETKLFYADDPLLKTKFIISTSSWQRQSDLQSYFNAQNGSLLCISSLSDPKQLQEIVSHSGSSLTVVFVQLSKSFDAVRLGDWLNWIFVKPEKNSNEKLQFVFNLSPLRKKMLENERKMQLILNKSECQFILIDR